MDQLIRGSDFSTPEAYLQAILRKIVQISMQSKARIYESVTRHIMDSVHSGNLLDNRAAFMSTALSWTIDELNQKFGDHLDAGEVFEGCDLKNSEGVDRLEVYTNRSVLIFDPDTHQYLGFRESP